MRRSSIFNKKIILLSKHNYLYRWHCWTYFLSVLMIYPVDAANKEQNQWILFVTNRLLPANPYFQYWFTYLDRIALASVVHPVVWLRGGEWGTCLGSPLSRGLEVLCVNFSQYWWKGYYPLIQCTPKQLEYIECTLKGSSFLDFSWTVTLCLSRGFSLAFVIAHVYYLQRKSVFARPLPNADFLGSDWFMRLWEGQPFSFEKILVMSL